MTATESIPREPNFQTRWPATPQEAWDQLQLSKEQVEQLRKVIHENYAQLRCSGKIFKKGIFLYQGASAPLPRTIVFLTSGEVLLSLKDVPLIGKGGERAVKPVYEAISGKIFAKKHVQPGSEEFKILDHFYKKPQIGVVKTIGFYGRNVVQEKYQGNLKQLLHSQKTLSSEIKLHLCSQLLEGLLALHSLPLGEHQHRLFHNDISTVNILYREGNQLEVVIDDFGQSGKWGVPDGKDWYFSPEVAGLKKQLAEGKIFSPEQLKAFNFSNGQKRDVWAMGLVLADIMKAGIVLPNDDCVGLKCVSQLVKQGADGVHALATQLTQKQIDLEIQAIQKKIPDTASGQREKRVWQLINQMLKIDPAKRISSQDAKIFLELI